MIETPDPTELIAIADLKLKEGDFFRIRDLSNHKKVRYNNEEHQAYAFTAWHVLINEFKRGEIRQFGANLNIAERTLSDILNKFIDKNLIHRVKNGLYAKR